MSKQPVPRNNLECFAGVVMAISEAYGVRNIPEIYQYVDMLFDAIRHYRAEEEHGLVDINADGNAERKRLFMLFAEKFRAAYGIDYPAQFSSADAKLALQVMGKVQSMGVLIDDYMKWLFDEYAAENEKLRIMQFKTIASDFFLNAFAVYVHDTGLDKIRALELKRSLEVNEVATRIRAIQREYGETRPDLIQKLKLAIEMLKSGKVSAGKVLAGLDRLRAQLSSEEGIAASEAESSSSSANSENASQKENDNGKQH